MDNFKKILIWLGKIILMLGILAALGVVWVIILLSMGNGLFDGPSGFFVLALSAVFLAVFIFMCVKISRIGTKKPDKSDSFGQKIKQPLSVIVPVIVIAAAVPVSFAVKDAMGDFFLKERAKNAVRTADEIIVYDYIGMHHHKILDTRIEMDSVVINYDKKTVSFIFYSNYEQFVQYRLKKGDFSSEQHLQYITKLSSPGKTFSTYYSGKENRIHLTTGLRLEMEDGSVYSLELDNEYFDIKTYPLMDILEAQEAADIVITYGRNVLPSNYSGIESDTLLIDSDTKTFSVVYGDDYAMTIKTFGLTLTDSIEGIYLQAKFDLNIGTLYAYTDRLYYEEKGPKKRTDGLVLITPDGKIFVDEYYGDSHGGGNWDFYNSDYRCREDYVNITSNGIEYDYYY